MCVAADEKTRPMASALNDLLTCEGCTQADIIHAYIIGHTQKHAYQARSIVLSQKAASSYTGTYRHISAKHRDVTLYSLHVYAAAMPCSALEN